MRTPDRKKVEIIKSVAPEWQEVCIQMDFDPNGKRMQLIDRTERDPLSRSRAMFTNWLDGKGVAATWGTLIQILEDCRYDNLLGEVKEALQISKGQKQLVGRK